MLANYITETQNLLNDNQGQFFSLPTLTNYINKSRRRIAALSGCLRVLPPGVQTVPNQEVYPFSDWFALVQTLMPQAQQILACRSVSISIGGRWVRDDSKPGGFMTTRGGWKPMWKRVPWTDFQARFRIYNGTFYGTISDPGWWAQYGDGPAGAIYLAPIPSQASPMEVDLTVIPTPLLSDKDKCPIPYPWTDAVCYWAAVLALIQQQRVQDAKAMADTFNAEMPFAASVVCPQMIQNVYGATIRSA
jgi:hypothetical protein